MQETAFKKFSKIPSLIRGIDEGLFIEDATYYVTEKLDGANLSVQRTEAGFIVCSRNNIVATYLEDDPSHNQIFNSFNGAVAYMFARADAILDLPQDTSIFGEWLVSHAVSYPQEMYGHFYAFERNAATRLNTKYVFPISIITHGRKDTIVDQAEAIIKDYKEEAGRDIEGIVLATSGMLQPQRFKVVLESFNDTKRKGKPQVVFSDVELEAVSFYTERAYKKIIEKIEDNLGRKINIKDTAQVIGRCSHDYFEEFFPQALKAMKYPTINTRKVKAGVEEQVRKVFTGTKTKWVEGGN